MKHFFSFLCMVASMLTMQAQTSMKETLTSPDGVLKVYINTHNNNLSYIIYEGDLFKDRIVYAADNAIALNIEGMGKNQYTVSKPKLVKALPLRPTSPSTLCGTTLSLRTSSLLPS